MKDNRGKKVERFGWKDKAGFLLHTFHMSILVFVPERNRKHVTESRVTNKVTVCDQEQKSNTLPLENGAI